MGKRSHDPAVSIPMTAVCTPLAPFKGFGLRPDVIIRHTAAYTDSRSGQRVCSSCGQQMGLDWERAWQKEERAKAKPGEGTTKPNAGKSRRSRSADPDASASAT